MITEVLSAILWQLRLIRRAVGLHVMSFKDGARYFRYSDLSSYEPSAAARQAAVLRLVHSLEKGLVMPPPRRPFGKEICDYLRNSLPGFHATPVAAWLTEYSREVIESVDIANRANGRLEEGRVYRGCIELRRNDIRESGPVNPQVFFKTRHSVRSFTGPPLSAEMLGSLVKGGQTAPSVCNRQGARVRFYNDESLKSSILRLQNGNGGFGHLIPTVAVVSCDLRMFIGFGERNQAWIDGGLFAMTLVLFAHSLGLGTCFLNWSVGPERDQQLRELLDIPDHEVVVTLLGLGEIDECVLVAESARRPIDEVWLNSDAFSGVREPTQPSERNSPGVAHA